MDALLTSWLLVAWTGMGSRSQLLCAAFSIRFANRIALIVGVALACLANAALSATGGALLAASISRDALLLFQALAILFAGIAMLLPRRPVDTLAGWPIGAFLTATLGLFILQFGDKGQFLLAANVGRTQAPLLVATGGWLGALTALIPAILLGDRIAHRLPLRAIRLAGGAVLTLGGVTLALNAFGLLA